MDLKKTESEINSMPSNEFVRWMAFYKVKFEYEHDQEPPAEFDDDAEADQALDELLGF
jgi:hypothetical protein